MTRTRLIHLVFAGVLGLLALAVALPQTGGLLTRLGNDLLHLSNATALAAAEDRVAADLSDFGEVKGMLDLLTGADHGAADGDTGTTEAGTILSPLSRIVADARSVTLAGATLLRVLRLLDAAVQALDRPAGAILLAAAATWLLLHCVMLSGLVVAVIRHVCIVAAHVFLLLHLVIPYTISATGWMLKDGPRLIAAEHGNVAGDLKADIVRHPATPEGLRALKDPATVTAALERAVKSLPQKTAAVGRYVAEEIAFLLVAGLLFPVLCGLFLWWLTGRILNTLADAIDAHLTAAFADLRG